MGTETKRNAVIFGRDALSRVVCTAFLCRNLNTRDGPPVFWFCIPSSGGSFGLYAEDDTLRWLWAHSSSIEIFRQDQEDLPWRSFS